jgi:tight adherence protein C
MFIVAMIGFAVCLGVFLFGRPLTDRQARDRKRAASRLHSLDSAAIAETEPADSSSRASSLGQAVLKVGAWMAPANAKQTADLGVRLARAGYPQSSAVLYFTGLQLLLVVTLALTFGGVLSVVGAHWTKCLLASAAGAALGLAAPSFILSAQMQKRQRQLRHAFPDALDILVLSIEGGASVNAAIAWVTEELRAIQPILGSEMAIVQREIQLGLSPGEAFQSFADRCGLDEARELAVALLQSERYGASIAKALRSHADAARLDRQMWAEEVAQKAAVKIIFPMLLCIFPAIFIVLLGPAAHQMSQLFAK